jgi:N6-L-threonylcarbamoyladenine synthase
LLEVTGIGQYRLLGDTLDDAAGEAFDKSAKLLGLGYPGGPAIARLADSGDPRRFELPRPMLRSGNLEFSFSGLKTAVATQVQRAQRDKAPNSPMDLQFRADLAAAVQAAIVEVLVAKSLSALKSTGHRTLVVAGGVSANRLLREQFARAETELGVRVCFPEPELCTDNGAMIAFAGALRLSAGLPAPDQRVRPRWPLDELTPSG